MANEKRSVLVVDDQRGMRLTLAGIIEDLGYQVTEVEDGYQAIRAASKTAFDLIFMDIEMRGIDGVETYREIKKRRPDSTVVMMTAFAVESLIKGAIKEGAFSVVYKPFDPKKVVEVIEAALRPLTVLVVDGRSSDRAELSAILGGKGYSVAEASGGDEAIRMAKLSHYDIVLMDAEMPGKNGFAATREIHGIDAGTKVIYTTSVPLDGSRGAGLEDARAVVRKPIDAADMLAVVARVAMEKTR